MGAINSKLSDVGAAGKSDAEAAEKSHARGAVALDDATRKAGAREAASAALAAIQKAAETAVAYVSGLFGAANSGVVSSYGALKRASAIAVNTIVELVKRLLGIGSDAVAVAKGQFDAVAAALRGGVSSFAATVAASLDAACSAVFPAGAREAMADVLPKLDPKAVASVVAVVRALIGAIPLAEKLLSLVIPPEVKVAIAVVAVAAGLYLALCGAMAGAPAAAAAGVMMKAPGSGAVQVALLRSAFEANPAVYFSLLRSVGPKAAAAAFPFVA